MDFFPIGPVSGSGLTVTLVAGADESNVYNDNWRKKQRIATDKKHFCTQVCNEDYTHT